MSRLLTTWMITFKEDDIVSEAVVHYDPKGSYKVRIYDLAYRHDQDGSWAARI